MKNLVLTFGLIFLGHLAFGQFLTLKSVREVKEGNLILGLSENKELNKDLIAVANTWWTYSEITEHLPLEQAKARAKADPNTFVLSLAYVEVEGMQKKNFDPDRRQIGYASGWEEDFGWPPITTGVRFEIENGHKPAFAFQYIPTVGEAGVTKESMVFGISALNDIFTTMKRDSLSNVFKLMKALKSNTGVLKEKELLIPEGYLHKKVSEEYVKSSYSGKADVVDFPTWREAILNQSEDAVYCTIVAVPTGSTYSYQHWFMEAATGKIIAIVYAKVAVNMAGSNLSSGNKEYITKKLVDKYEKAYQGKW